VTRRSLASARLMRSRASFATVTAVLSLLPHAASAQQAAFDRTRPPALGATPVLTVPTVTERRLPNGPALKVVEHRELPLVQITLTLAGGARLDRDLPGLATFTANLLDEGAGRRDANALQSELAFLGASLSTSASWDVTTISLKVAKRNLDAALDLMADVVLRPSFAAGEVRRQRDLRLASLLQAKDQPGTLASLAFNQALHPDGHPYRAALGGDSTSTARLDSATVRAFYDGSADEADVALGKRFAAWRTSGPERRPAPVLAAAAKPQGLQLILVDKPGAAQSIITVGTTGVERTSADLAAIEVMNTILGGSFSSRLNSNLRETKGYTYGISSGFAYRPLAGPFTVSSAVRTNVTDSALVEIFKELTAIRDVPVSADELARAKAYLALAIPGDLESTSQIASELAYLANWNLPVSWLQEYVTRIGQVTATDVQRVARQFLPTQQGYIVVVGDLSKVRAGIEALRLGPVTVREVGAIARE
jgi:zinc protease